MEKYTVQQCKKCGQKLRFPHKIGGMLMACPNCGQKFQSDFKLKGSTKTPLFLSCEEHATGLLPRLKNILNAVFFCWFKK